MMRKHIYIAYTGGTIGMEMTADGYAPVPGYLQQLMQNLHQLRNSSLPEYTLHEYSPLLDSSNMTPADWMQIACDIKENYDRYDGFIVLHGTDTMAYTASALSFVLEGLNKPVILTGSQLPLCEVRSDAHDNLVASLLIAANYSIPEVCLFFGNILMRGCRATKVRADSFEAFSSPNYPPLGTAGIELRIDPKLIRPMPPEGSGLNVRELDIVPVGLLWLFPGITAEMVRKVLQPPIKGIVLQVYGRGNGPDRDVQLLAALGEAADRDLVIVACTQCLQGTVDLHGYATGSALAKAGVVSGFDMTTEAALTKMLYLFGHGHAPTDVRTRMRENLRGELTLPASP